MLFGNQVVSTTHTSGNGYYIQKTAGKYQNGNLNSELQSARYLFNTSGALTTREETQSVLSGGFDLKERFTYDTLNRVKSSHVYRKNTNASQQLINSANYRYDDLGNLNYRSDKGGTFYYNQTNGASVHGVTQANGQTYKYDEYGNVTQKGNSQISYNIFNKPSNIDGQLFYYGADHKCYKKVDADGTKTYYLMGGMYEEIVKGPKVIHNSYVDGVYLLQETVSYGYMGNTKRRYLLQDHLGSTSVITNESGLIEERLSFNTWGERRASDWSTNSVSLNGLTSTRGFTGHEMLDDSGLIHMNGRVYDPTAGRFLSADILIQAPSNTQSYNRYSYVLNNPLSYVDPTGYESEENSENPPVCNASEGCITVTGSRREQIRHEMDVMNALADYYNKLDRGEVTSDFPTDYVSYDYGAVTKFNPRTGSVDIAFKQKISRLNRNVRRQTRNMLRKYKKGKFRFGKGEKITYAQAVWLWRFGGGRGVIVDNDMYTNNNIFSKVSGLSLITAAGDHWSPYGDATKVFGSEKVINGRMTRSTYDFDFKTSGFINLTIRNYLNQQAIYEHGAGTPYDISSF